MHPRVVPPQGIEHTLQPLTVGSPHPAQMHQESHPEGTSPRANHKQKRGAIDGKTADLGHGQQDHPRQSDKVELSVHRRPCNGRDELPCSDGVHVKHSPVGAAHQRTVAGENDCCGDEVCEAPNGNRKSHRIRVGWNTTVLRQEPEPRIADQWQRSHGSKHRNQAVPLPTPVPGNGSMDPDVRIGHGFPLSELTLHEMPTNLRAQNVDKRLVPCNLASRF